jgi:hypothetical protein
VAVLLKVGADRRTPDGGRERKETWKKAAAALWHMRCEEKIQAQVRRASRLAHPEPQVKKKYRNFFLVPMSLLCCRRATTFSEADPE